MPIEKKDFVNIYFREADMIKGWAMKESKVVLAKQKVMGKDMMGSTDTSGGKDMTGGKDMSDSKDTSGGKDSSSGKSVTSKKGAGKGKPPSSTSHGLSTRQGKKETPPVMVTGVVLQDKGGEGEDVPAIIKFPGWSEVLRYLKEAANLSDMMVFMVEVLLQMPDRPAQHLHVMWHHSLNIEDDMSVAVMPIREENHQAYTLVFTSGAMGTELFYNALSCLIYGHKLRLTEMRA